jgi:hypothetical protein
MISFRQEAFVRLGFGISATFLFLLAGCTIEKYTGPVSGDLFVSATDDSGHVVLGARISLDGMLRSEVTPDTLKNILTGPHSLRIEKYGYLVFQDTNVVVEAYVTTSYQAVIHISNTGALSVDVTGGTGMVIVDGVSLEGTAPGVFPNVPTGSHSVSLFRNGYLTSPATLVPVEIVWQETTGVNFQLILGNLGSNVDSVAPDFTLLNDNLDSVSLHSFRGHVVLVNFWYST